MEEKQTRTRIDECNHCCRSTSFETVVVCLDCFRKTIKEKDAIIETLQMQLEQDG